MYNDHVNTDMSYEDFCELCRNCWRQKYGFLVTDKDSALTDGRHRNGFNDFAIPWHDQLLTIHWHVTNKNEEIKDRKKIAKQFVKTSDSIHKKYLALKISKIKEDIALERHFKSIVEPLKQTVKNTVGEKSDVESGEWNVLFGESQNLSENGQMNRLTIL